MPGGANGTDYNKLLTDEFEETFWNKDPIKHMLRDMGDQQKRFLKNQFVHDMNNMAKRYDQVLGSNFSNDFLMPLDQQPRRLDKAPFQVKVDINGYEPNEVCIKVIKDNVSIEGKHEETREGKSFVSRQFSRKYTLPQNVKAEKLKSALGPDGILTITAPYEQDTQGSTIQEIGSSSQASKQTFLDDRHAQQNGFDRLMGQPDLDVHSMMQSNDLLRDVARKVSERHRQFFDTHFEQPKLPMPSFNPLIGRSVFGNGSTDDMTAWSEAGSSQGSYSSSNTAAPFDTCSSSSTVPKVKQATSRSMSKDNYSTSNGVAGSSNGNYSPSSSNSTVGSPVMNSSQNTDDSPQGSVKKAPRKIIDKEVVHHNLEGIDEKQNEYQIKVDVSQFDPADLSVKSVNKCLIVEGKQEDADGNVVRHMTKKYELPEEVSPEKISSSLSKQGVLTVKIPKNTPEIEAARQVLCSALAKKSAEKGANQFYSHIIVPL